jgi:HK97 gp10 family phage protein
MANVTVKIKSIKPKYDASFKGYDKELKKLVKFAVNDVRNFAVQNIAQGVKSGKIRRDGSRASASGEFPATDQGTLIQNITGIIAPLGLSGTVESKANYSSFLEFGTSSMGARPFLQPSLEQVRPKIKRLIARIKGI